MGRYIGIIVNGPLVAFEWTLYGFEPHAVIAGSAGFVTFCLGFSVGLAAFR